MKIRILDSALADLDLGCRFYEALGEGLGAYLMDSIFSEIDSLFFLPAYTERSLDIID